MRYLTVRNVPDAVARELDRERRRRGQVESVCLHRLKGLRHKFLLSQGQE